MKLGDLLSVLPEYQAQKKRGTLLTDEQTDLEISGLQQDGRKVQPGMLFIAISGTQADGHQFIPQAIQSGAVALVVEKKEAVPDHFLGPVIVVGHSRESLDRLAGRFFQDPSKEMFCLGVTGTNGKTSTTYLFEAIMKKARIRTGVLGTINHHLEDRVWETAVTTPDPIALQDRLKEMKDMGAKAIAMEVSSHALSQYRADGVHFNTVVFTNLTRDHLDYHANMEEYFQSKQRLFTDLMWMTEKKPHFAIVNTDDPWGARLRVASSSALWTYGQGRHADFRFELVKMDFSRTDFKLTTPFGEYTSSLPMCGIHNLYNMVGALAAAVSCGVPPGYCLEALEQFAGVPGRLQFVPNSQSLNVFVDYAHTPDALENVLKALTQVRRDLKAHAQIWTVFGCGGDRDKGKRPLMAETAVKYSDFVMVTSDNPRTEDPRGIITDILSGVSVDDRKRKVMSEVDRKRALTHVFDNAKPHDVILIAGKGHEDYQILGAEKIHFSDFEIAKELLQ